MTEAVRRDVLQLIGSTRLGALRHVRPASGARVLLKYLAAYGAEPK